MKSQEDKRIQEQLDQGKKMSYKTGNNQPSIDEKAYELLFEALDSPPDYTLPANFATKVTNKVLPQQQTASTTNEDAKLMVFVGLLIFGIAGIIFWIFGINIPTDSVQLSPNLLRILGGSIVLIILIQIADQKWIKPRISKL